MSSTRSAAWSKGRYRECTLTCAALADAADAFFYAPHRRAHCRCTGDALALRVKAPLSLRPLHLYLPRRSAMSGLLTSSRVALVPLYLPPDERANPNCSGNSEKGRAGVMLEKGRLCLWVPSWIQAQYSAERYTSQGAYPPFFVPQI